MSRKLTISIIVPVFISILFSPCVLTVSAVIEDSWTTKLPMSTAREKLGVAVVNGKVYAIGGYKSGSGVLGTNEEYDPSTNTWTTKAPMPTPRRAFAITAWGNKIFCIGGTDGTDTLGVNEVYDPSTDSWTTLTSMPTPRQNLCANVVNGRIYLIGGASVYNQYHDINEVYDPSLDSWTTKAPVPTVVNSYASAVVDNKIYLLGGVAYGESALNQVYDPATNTWDFGKNLPNKVAAAAAGATTGAYAPKRIYVLFGQAHRSYNMVYDPESDTWTSGTLMPTIRESLGVAVVDDILYAIGGYSEEVLSVTTKNEQYTPFGYDIIPPEISIPLQEPPENVAANQSVTVTVNVTDAGSGVYNVTLWYSIDNGTDWIPLNMTEILENTYESTIPGYENCTWITYKIVAFDNIGNQAVQDKDGQCYIYHVIPEFPSLLILPLFMTAALLAVIVYRRKHSIASKCEEQ